MKAVLVLVAALAFVAAPLMTPDFGGYDPANFPIPLQDPAIVPAGYAFAIWGGIYVWLVLHAGFGLLARDEDAGWDRVRWPLFGSLALGASWLMVAMADPLLATVQIWAMLVLALAALLRAPVRQDRWLLSAPLALYAGWLTAASAVSLGTVLIGYGVLGEMPATYAMLALALAIGVAVQRRVRTPEYAGAIIWALAAIVVANFGRGVGVALACGLAMVVMARVTLPARARP